MVMYETIRDPVSKLLRCAFNVDVWSVADRRVHDRLAACDGCEHQRKVAGVRQCGKCKCILNCKARVPTEECPIGKWKAGEATLTVSCRVIETMQEGPH